MLAHNVIHQGLSTCLIVSFYIVGRELISIQLLVNQYTHLLIAEKIAGYGFTISPLT